MFDTTQFAEGIVRHCMVMWPQEYVLSAFEGMAEGVTPLANDGAITGVRHMVEGALIGGGVDLSAEKSGAREELIAACLGETRRRMMPSEVRLVEGGRGNVLSRHPTAFAALMAIAGRKVNELEWDGDDLIVWIAPRG